MAETFAFGFLTGLALIKEEMAWNNNAIMWLEMIPDHFLSEKERENGIRFERYQPDTTFEEWPRGRIFSDSGEIKWEKSGQKFHVVFCGHAPVPPSLQVVSEPYAEHKDFSYFLWGSRIKKEDLIDLGLQENEVAFAELQIPRVFHYPVSEQAKRVKMKVREFYNAEGTRIFVRFFGLEESQ